MEQIIIENKISCYEWMIKNSYEMIAEYKKTLKELKSMYKKRKKERGNK